MNTQQEFENLIARVIDNLDNPALLTELAVLATTILVTWLVLRLLRRRYAQPPSPLRHLNLSDWNRLVFPAVLLPMVLIGRTVLNEWQDVHLLNLAVPLIVSFVAIQICFYILRRVLKPSPDLALVERIISWLVWGVLALHLTGYLNKVIQALDAVGVNVGKQHLSLYTVLTGVLSVTATALVALWLAHLLESRLIGAMPLTANLRVAMTKLSRGLFIVLAILVALPLVGIDITVLSVFGGALGVGLGLGLQKIAANYVSGFTLLLEQSIRIGDLVQVDKYSGVVREIATRYTVLRTLNGNETIIPNEAMITNPVVNTTLSKSNAQVILPVSVAYDTDLNRVRELLLDIASRHDRVVPTPDPRVRLQSFGDNGINMELAVWIQDPEEGEAILRSDLNWEIWEAFKHENIEIPYPQRVVRMQEKAGNGLASGESSGVE